MMNTQKEMSIEQRVETLLQEMTIEEKAGQMTQVMLDVLLKGSIYKPSKPYAFDDEKLHQALVESKVGSVLNVPTTQALTREQWHYFISIIQEKAMKDTRLRIPILYGIDAVHGVNYTMGSTLFPHQIGMAATWNLDLIEQGASATAYEVRASGIPWTFSPVQDVCRNPVWSRIYETFGEDSYLSSEMGKAVVKGYEGDDVSNPYKVASCLKHFAGYGMPISGKDRTPTWIPEHYFREYFLPSFRETIKAGAHTVMINSGEINGIPVHADHHILTTILRNELGFKGVAVTDWEDIKYLHSRHHVASSHKEAVRMAIEAGIDMSMVPDDLSFTKYLIELVNEGSIAEERLDLSVRRILTLKFQLGLFENPLTTENLEYEKFGSEEHQAMALETARESITLLKNEENQLPISKNKKILVVGWAANSMRPLNGGWSYDWQGETSDEFATDKMTLLEAIQTKVGEGTVEYEEGCTYDELKNVEIAIEKALLADEVILCLGENSYTEFMGNLNDMNLPQAQIDLAKALAETAKPITLVLLEGRPRIISSFANSMKSIVQGYYPSQEGAMAIADVLFGDYNPCGKLPYTYPRYANSLITYDYKNAEALEIQGSEVSYNPQFEFGFGMSFTTFEYSDLQINQTDFEKADLIEISVNVKNTGTRKGKEVVQLYVRDEYASITPPVKRLRRFQKIELAPNESQKVQFSLHVCELAFVDRNNKWVLEEGDFTAIINNLKKKFKLI